MKIWTVHLLSMLALVAGAACSDNDQPAVDGKAPGKG